ncbi:MAG: GntR family transcriptional regulator [Oscillospiraceae bacterium]
MEWHFSDNAPIYSQIVWQLKLNIASGVLMPGERLASVRELAVSAGVNPNTMQRALSELERDGLLYTQRTSGRFVTEDTSMIEDTKRNIARDHIKSFLEAMKKLGFEQEDIHLLISNFEREENINANT